MVGLKRLERGSAIGHVMLLWGLGIGASLSVGSGGCGPVDDETGGPQASSGSHWLRCDRDVDCGALGDATCGPAAVCVDAQGEPIEVPAPTPGAVPAPPGATPLPVPTPPSADGGSPGGDGGPVDAGGYDPCEGKVCGDVCQLCSPSDTGCLETQELKTCHDGGACNSGNPPFCSGAGMAVCEGSVVAGASCSLTTGDDASGAVDCCQGGSHLRCEITGCTDGIPGGCFGVWAEVVGSNICGGAVMSYAPCAGKACGDPCTKCAPDDAGCTEPAGDTACDASGACEVGAAACEPCDAFDPDSCDGGRVCCGVMRCGPVGTSMGVCEEPDPSTGGCRPCPCASEPFGCPICNAPDTPIMTPDGERAVSELREGDLVFSQHQGAVVAVPVLATRSVRVFDHAVVRLALDTGQQLQISGSHPTADGRRLDSLRPGDALGEVRVLSVELVPYEHARTYDILPASDSGTYLAGGAWIGSTLR